LAKLRRTKMVPIFGHSVHVNCCTRWKENICKWSRVWAELFKLLANYLQTTLMILPRCLTYFYDFIKQDRTVTTDILAARKWLIWNARHSVYISVSRTISLMASLGHKSITMQTVAHMQVFPRLGAGLLHATCKLRLITHLPKQEGQLPY